METPFHWNIRIAVDLMKTRMPDDAKSPMKDIIVSTLHMIEKPIKLLPYIYLDSLSRKKVAHRLTVLHPLIKILIRFEYDYPFNICVGDKRCYMITEPHTDEEEESGPGPCTTCHLFLIKPQTVPLRVMP
jgi:hypothetical protein